MRELTVRIRFTKHCLGNSFCRKFNDGRRLFARTPAGRVLFPTSWHASNMVMAARLLSRHLDEVGKILWDVEVDSPSDASRVFRRYYTGHNGKKRFAVHEAFFPDQVVGLNCWVPGSISDDDFLQLMNLAGQYKGLSPWAPGEYGQFRVESITERRGPPPAAAADEQRNSEDVMAGTNGRR